MTAEQSEFLSRGEAARLREWLRSPDGIFVSGRMRIKAEDDGRLRIAVWPPAADAAPPVYAPIDHQVLALLRSSGAPVSPAEISRRVEITMVAVHISLDRLRTAGLAITESFGQWSATGRPAAQ